MKKLNAMQAKELQNEINIIDVRNVDELKETRLETIIHLPMALIPFKHQEVLDKSKEYYIICRSGARAQTAKVMLNDLGYKTEAILGGMMDI